MYVHIAVIWYSRPSVIGNGVCGCVRACVRACARVGMRVRVLIIVYLILIRMVFRCQHTNISSKQCCLP